MENGLFMAPFIYHLTTQSALRSLIHSSVHGLMAEPNSQGATFIGRMIGDCSLAVAYAGLWDQTNDPRFSVSTPPAELHEN